MCQYVIWGFSPFSPHKKNLQNSCFSPCMLKTPRYYSSHVVINKQFGYPKDGNWRTDAPPVFFPLLLAGRWRRYSLRPRCSIHARQHSFNKKGGDGMSPKLRRMIKPVLAVYGASPDIILEQNEKGNVYKAQVVSRPRNVAMYVVRKRTDMSFPEIAREFGVKNHVTVLRACKAVESTPKLLSVAKGFVMQDKSFDEAQASYEESMQSGEEPTYSSSKKEAKEQWEADNLEDENR